MKILPACRDRLTSRRSRATDRRSLCVDAAPLVDGRNPQPPNDSRCTANRIDRLEGISVDFEVVQLLSFAIGATGTALAARVAFAVFDRFRRRQLEDAEPKATLEYKLSLISTLSGELSRLNAEIQEEFDRQLEETKTLKGEAAAARALANQHADAVEATDARLEKALRRTTRTERAFQIVLAVIIYALGIGSTLLIQYLSAPHA